MNNHVKLKHLDGLSAAELSALPIEQISDLQSEFAELLADTKAMGAKIAEAIAIRFEPLAAAERIAKKKDTGSVTVAVDGFKCVSDIPKKVEWDQDKLSDAIGKLLFMGKEADHFVNYIYSVSETGYSQMEPEIKALFTPARTVKPGMPTYKLNASAGAQRGPKTNESPLCS